MTYLIIESRGHGRDHKNKFINALKIWVLKFYGKKAKGCKEGTQEGFEEAKVSKAWLIPLSDTKK